MSTNSNSIQSFIITAAVFVGAAGVIYFSFLSQTNRPSYVMSADTMTADTYPVVIVGGGVGGLTSAVYLSLANIKTYVAEGDTPGGLLTQSHSVRNWPGEIDSPGAAITEKLRSQALRAGAAIKREIVTSIDLSSWPYTLTVQSVDDKNDTKTIRALSVILGVGAKSNYLGIPGEEQYWGRGVTNCAVCEGSLYKDRVVCVVGGGDSAMEEASYLSEIAKKVYVFVRSDKLRALDNRKDEVLAKSNVEFVFNTLMRAVVGDGQRVIGVVTQDKESDEHKTVPMDGVFLAVGFTPNTAMLEGQVNLTSRKYIKLYHDQETSVSGVYAVGDVVDPVYKQAVTASGDGCRAALQSIAFLQACGYSAQKSAEPQSLQKEKMASVGGKPLEESSDAVDGLHFSAGGVIEVSSENDFYQLFNMGKPVLVDFYATWCMPCKRVAPLFKKLAKEYAGEMIFAKVNIDSVGTIGQSERLQGVPTFIAYVDGKPVAREEGALSQSRFKEIIDPIVEQA